jgi:hypothetical protein
MKKELTVEIKIDGQLLPGKGIRIDLPQVVAILEKMNSLGKSVSAMNRQLSPLVDGVEETIMECLLEALPRDPAERLPLTELVTIEHANLLLRNAGDPSPGASVSTYSATSYSVVHYSRHFRTHREDPAQLIEGHGSSLEQALGAFELALNHTKAAWVAKKKPRSRGVKR